MINPMEYQITIASLGAEVSRLSEENVKLKSKLAAFQSLAIEDVAPTTDSRGLTLNDLHIATMRRITYFKAKDGEKVHGKSGGSDWTPAQWLQAMLAALGEYANHRKRFERQDMNISEFTTATRTALADIQCYLAILAARCLDEPDMKRAGINLSQSVIDTFNKVSATMGSTVTLPLIAKPSKR